MDWDALPRRASDLDVNTVPDGYIVYQASRDRVHYLNHTAVVVFELCSGQVRAADIPGLLERAYGLSAPPADDVAACLDSLITEGLVQA